MRALALLLLTACATVRPLAMPPLPLRVDTNLLDFLAWAQKDAGKETVACLTGAVQRGSIIVDGLTLPRVYTRSDVGVAYAGCRGRGVLGLWHPHVGPYAPLCEFSEPDRDSFKASGLMVDLLGCGRGEFRYALADDTTTRVLARR